MELILQQEVLKYQVFRNDCSFFSNVYTAAAFFIFSMDAYLVMNRDTKNLCW